MRGKPVRELLDRETERATLRSLVDDVRSGRGRVLIVRGEARGGKVRAS
jgi:predicted ATPase